MYADASDQLKNLGKFVIDIFHVPTGKSVLFKAWVTSFSDSYESNWNTEEAYGKMDPISTFQNTARTLTLEWDVVAASVEEAKDNMNSCELLFMMLYPSYDGGGDNASNMMQAPLFKIKFGNLVTIPGAAAAADASTAGLLGTLGGFEFSPDFDSGFFTPAAATMYPQLISLSAEFQVLHNFPLGWNGKSFRGGDGFPYGKSKATLNAKDYYQKPTGLTEQAMAVWDDDEAEFKAGFDAAMKKQAKAERKMTKPGKK